MDCSKLIFDSATGRVICEDTGEVVAEDIIEDEHYPFYRSMESVERFNTKPEHRQIHVVAPINVVNKNGAKRLARMIKKIAREQELPQSVYNEAISLMKNYIEMVGGLDEVSSRKTMAKAFLKIAMLRRDMLPLNINRKEKGLFRAVNNIIRVMNLKPTQEFTKEERVMAAIDHLNKELNLPMPIYVRAVDLASKNVHITVYNPNAYKWLAGVCVYFAACLAGHKEVTLNNVMRMLSASFTKFNRKVMWKVFFSLNEEERVKALGCLGLMKSSKKRVWIKFVLPEDKVEYVYKVAGQSKEDIARFIASNLDKVDIVKVAALKNKLKQKKKKVKKVEVHTVLPYEDFIKLKELEVKRYEISKEDILLYMVSEALKKLKTDVKQSAT